MLLTSNFYSLLYYNCEIWLSQGLNARHKQQILAASSNALKILGNVSGLRTSFVQLHINEKRALPVDFGRYKMAIQLHKIYNGVEMNSDWVDMNHQQNFNARSRMFQINDYSRLKIGKNILCNRLNELNNRVDLDWLNLSLISFKLKMKSIFLINWHINELIHKWLTKLFFLNVKASFYDENKQILILILIALCIIIFFFIIFCVIFSMLFKYFRVYLFLFLDLNIN